MRRRGQGGHLAMQLPGFIAAPCRLAHRVTLRVLLLATPCSGQHAGGEVVRTAVMDRPWHQGPRDVAGGQGWRQGGQGWSQGGQGWSQGGQGWRQGGQGWRQGGQGWRLAPGR